VPKNRYLSADTVLVARNNGHPHVELRLEGAFPYTLGTPHTRVLRCAFPYTFGTLVALCQLMDLGGTRALEVFEAGFTSLQTSQLVQLGQDLVTTAGSRSLSTSGKAFLLSSLVCTISALLVVLQTLSASLAISSELVNDRDRLMLSVAKVVVGIVRMIIRTAFPYTFGTPNTRVLRRAFPYTFGTLVALCQLMDLGGTRALEVFEAGFTRLPASQLVQLGQDLVTTAGSRSLSTSGKAFLLSSLVCTISALLVVLQTLSASLAISSELVNDRDRLMLSVAKVVVGIVRMILRTAFPYTLGTPHTPVLHCAFPYTFGTLVALCQLMDLGGTRALEVFEAGFTSLQTSQLIQLGDVLDTTGGSRGCSTSSKACVLSPLVSTISALLVVLQSVHPLRSPVHWEMAKKALCFLLQKR
jgi:hypothetical protein